MRQPPTRASRVNASNPPRPIVTAATSAANSQLALSPTVAPPADPPLPNDRLRRIAPKGGLSLAPRRHQRLIRRRRPPCAIDASPMRRETEGSPVLHRLHFAYVALTPI